MKQGKELKRLFGYDLSKLSFDEYPALSRPVEVSDGVVSTILADEAGVDNVAEVFADLDRFGRTAVPRLVLFFSELTKGKKTRDAMKSCGMDWGMINLCLRINKGLRKIYDCAKKVQLEAMGNEVVDAAWKRVVDGYDEVVTNNKGIVYDDDGKPLMRKNYCDGRLAERLLMVSDKRFSPENTGEKPSSGITYNINGCDVKAYLNVPDKKHDDGEEEVDAEVLKEVKVGDSVVFGKRGDHTGVVAMVVKIGDNNKYLWKKYINDGVCRIAGNGSVNIFQERYIVAEDRNGVKYYFCPIVFYMEKYGRRN